MTSHTPATTPMPLPRRRSLFPLLVCIFIVLPTLVGIACSAQPPLTPEQEDLVDRLERVEKLLGRHGWTDDYPYMQALREEAATLDLPVAEARVRLILGRRPAAEHARAHLELAAEAFREHDEPGREALALLELARELRRLHLNDPLFASGHRDEAVRALERAARLARGAEDPLTAGEAHWVLGAIHRIEDAKGPSIEHFERAAEQLGRAGEPLLLVAARIEVANAYGAIGDQAQSQAILEAAIEELRGRGDFDDLAEVARELEERASYAATATNSRRMAERLRERGLEETAAHLDRVAAFFEERGDRIDRHGWSPEDQQAMGEVMRQAPKPRIEPRNPPKRTSLGGTVAIPLDEYMEEHPDQALVRRAFDLVMRSEVEKVDHQIRRLRLQRRLSGQEEEHREASFGRFLEQARETGYMPDLPVNWFLRRFEEAPEKYREGNALAMWAEHKAAELYFRLGRRVENFQGIPPEDNGSLYRPINAWQLRYCENLKQALERIGEPLQHTCNARNTFHTMADRFSHDVHLDGSEVSQGSRIDALEEKKRRLVALRQDPSRLEEELEDALLADILDGLFYDERHPVMAVQMATRNAPLEKVLAVKQASAEIDMEGRQPHLEARLNEIQCLLTQRRTLHDWLAQLADAEGYEEKAASHRAWIEDLETKQRRRLTPTGFAPAPSPSEAEPRLRPGCDGASTSFISLVTAGGPDSTGRSGPLEEAQENLAAGRNREALRTLRAFEEADIDRPELRAAVLEGLGRAHLGLGDRGRALDAFQRSVSALEEVIGGFRHASWTTIYAGRAADAYDRVIELMVAEGRHREAFDYAERARARGFLHRAAGAALGPVAHGGEVPEVLRQAENDLRSRLVRLENLRARPELHPEWASDGKKVLDQIERDLETVRHEYARVLQRIGGDGSSDPSLTRVNAADLAEVRDDLLPEGGVLVEYHLLADRGFAWVVDERSVQLVEIDEGRERIGNRVGILREAIAERAPYQQFAASLYEILVAPVLPHVRGRTVILAPHGPLHHLPFASLWNRAAGRHLVEELTWTTVPSASSLRQRGSGGSGAPPSRPLVLGDPDGTLPAARESARRVARIFGVDPLLEEDATERAFRERLAEADLLHVGAHARLNGSDPLFSAIVLAPAPEAESSSEDGRLELYEVHQLDLRHVDLVTLSACNTAQGHRTSGDDVTTLQRAFLASGAGQVVSTLWSIEDDASAAWSQAFYQRLREGDTVPSALASAQRRLLEHKEWRHPFFWAGFVASGGPGG